MKGNQRKYKENKAKTLAKTIKNQGKSRKMKGTLKENYRESKEMLRKHSKIF